MSITGTDDMGPYVDTGVNTAPSARPVVDQDSHTALGVRPRLDTWSTQTEAFPVARRTPGQRR